MENIDPTYETLLIRKLSGETLSDKEQADLNAWLASDEQNSSYANELSWIWNQTESNAVEVDVNKAFSKVQAKIPAQDNVIPITSAPKKSSQTKVIKLLVQLAVAASIIAAVVWFLPSSSHQADWQQVASTNTIQTFKLNDGSNIRLDKNTTLSVDKSFGKDFRAVKLTGKAFFDIQRNEEKPFIIYSNDAIVKVLGTSFSVEQEGNDKVVVKVKSGVVQVFNNQQNVNEPAKFIQLTKGETGYWTSASNEVIKESSTVKEEVFDWAEQRIKFNDENIESVVTRLENIYSTKISFENEGMKYCRITYSVKRSSIEETLETLASTFDWEYQKTQQGYILIGDSCQP